MPAVKPRAWLFDLFGDYVEYRSRELWTGSLIVLAADFDISERAIRSALLRLQRDGWFAVRRVGARSYYGLTDAGRELIDRGRERIMHGPKHDWDGRWALVTYTIPESRRELRDRFRTELGWLGFGGLGSGLFVSPRDHRREIGELAERYGLAENVTLFRGEHVLPGDDRALAAHCWDLAALNEGYASFVRTFDAYCGDIRGLSDKECFVVRCRLLNSYRRFPFRDPGLPLELLPEGWEGFRAATLFADLHDRLAAAANRHFDRVASAA